MSYKIFDMKFSRVYNALLEKAYRKNRSKEEVNQITSEFTGYSILEIEEWMQSEKTYGDFFRNMPKLNSEVILSGKICGIIIEDIQEPIMKKIRYLDKLIDDLVKGKKVNG